MLSIVFQIITAIFTTCSVLGSLHTKQLLELLNDDIHKEREKHEFEYHERGVISLNEVKLRHSQQDVLSMKLNSVKKAILKQSKRHLCNILISRSLMGRHLFQIY